MASNTTKVDAEARYAKAQKRAIDARKAQSEAETEAKRVNDNTVRLRALRIAKEAADAAAAAAAPPKVKAKRKKAAPKAAKAIPVDELNAEDDG